jgi:uncharacterized protein
MTMTEPKHTLEDEYFIREDAEKKRKLALQVKKETEASELARLKALHHMHCPKCGLPLHEVKLGAVKVDVCFVCHGGFLERSDLEQLLKPEQKGVVEAMLNWFKRETHG